MAKHNQYMGFSRRIHAKRERKRKRFKRGFLIFLIIVAIIVVSAAIYL